MIWQSVVHVALFFRALGICKVIGLATRIHVRCVCKAGVHGGRAHMHALHHSFYSPLLFRPLALHPWTGTTMPGLSSFTQASLSLILHLGPNQLLFCHPSAQGTVVDSHYSNTLNLKSSKGPGRLLTNFYCPLLISLISSLIIFLSSQATMLIDLHIWLAYFRACSLPLNTSHFSLLIHAYPVKIQL
jgi:hypothetical protein